MFPDIKKLEREIREKFDAIENRQLLILQKLEKIAARCENIDRNFSTYTHATED